MSTQTTSSPWKDSRRAFPPLPQPHAGEPITPRSEVAQSFAPAAPPYRHAPLLWRWIGCLGTWILGAAACMHAISAVLVVGWTHRRMQWTIQRRWAKMGSRESVPAVPKPTWLTERGWRLVEMFSFVPLWRNAKTGMLAVFNSYVLTGPACALWLFAWRFGWDNSFNKVYEQSAIGPATWFSGMGLFIAAMLYLPIAQSRHAATGDWRAFYDVRTWWAVLNRTPFSWLTVSMLYPLISVPLYVLIIAPSFFTQDEVTAAMSDNGLLLMLIGWFAIASLVLFPMYVGLRLIAARVYARALVRAVHRGKLPISRLLPNEAAALRDAGLLYVDPPGRSVVVEMAGFGAKFSARAMLGLAAVLIWVFVAFQLTTLTFIQYTPRRWVMQPLIQLPTVVDIPDHLLEGDASKDVTDISSFTGA